jgi:hypothetical protein
VLPAPLTAPPQMHWQHSRDLDRESSGAAGCDCFGEGSEWQQ